MHRFIHIIFILSLINVGCTKDVLDIELTNHEQQRIVGEGFISQDFKNQRFHFSLSNGLGSSEIATTDEANLLVKTQDGAIYYNPIAEGWYESSVPFEGQSGFNYTIQFTYQGEFHEVNTEMPSAASIKKLILPDTNSFSYPYYAQNLAIEMSSEADQNVHFDLYHISDQWREIPLPVYQKFPLVVDTAQIINVPLGNTNSSLWHIGDTLVIVSKTLSDDVSDYLEKLQSYVTSEIVNSQYYNPPFYYSNGAYGLGYGSHIDTIYHIIGE